MSYTPKYDYRVKDSLPSGNTAKVIRGTELMEEFEAISNQFISNNQKGVVASCKYNGQFDVGPNYGLMYKVNVTSVENGWAPAGGSNPNGLLPGQYRVNFDTNIPEFDQHYAPVVTSFPAIVNGMPAYPCVIALQEFQADSVTFTVHQIGGGENGAAPESPTGFSLLIVDMEPPV
jgi:hypothetical protein